MPRAWSVADKGEIVWLGQKKLIELRLRIDLMGSGVWFGVQMCILYFPPDKTIETTLVYTIN